MSESKSRKPLHEVLKEAMAAKKKAASGVDRGPLRGQKNQGKPMPDAERRRAMSRKVH